MTKNKANKLLQRRTSAILMPAADLIVSGELNTEKLSLTTRENKIIVAFKDLDGKPYVVDGRHATVRAQRKGEQVPVVFVQETEIVGRQSALDRVLGMILKKKES